MQQFLKTIFGTKRREFSAHLDFPLVIEGHGLSVAPRLPSSIAHLDDGTLILAHGPDEAVKNALVKPGAKAVREAPEERQWNGVRGDGFWLLRNRPGGTAIALGAGMTETTEVFDAIEAGDTGPWRLHAPAFVIDWPESFTLRTTLGSAPFPFELSYQGSEDMFLHLQGPFCGASQIPTTESLVGAGQKMLNQGSIPGALGAAHWVEIGYQFDGEAWRQRYYYVVYDNDCVYLLKAQVRASVREPMWSACEKIVASFGPRH